jgi:hypothetical protein
MLIVAEGSSAQNRFVGEKLPAPVASGPDRCGGGHAVVEDRAPDQLTISQPPHDIMPLDDVLADVKPHECGSLVGVRLIRHRSLDVYRLRILKDTGGVIDLYVNARTGVPL